MLEPTDFKNESKSDLEKSKECVNEILETLDYSLDELESSPTPTVLVLGTGPFFPEAHLIKDWAEKKERTVDLECVDRDEMVNREYMKHILNWQDSKFLNFELINEDFEKYNFNKQYDLVLMLRISNLGDIGDNVFSSIADSLKGNGVFLMSGGIPSYFLGSSLSNSDLRVEKHKELEYSSKDFYKGYPGKNTAAKFRKI